MLLVDYLGDNDFRRHLWRDLVEKKGADNCTRKIPWESFIQRLWELNLFSSYIKLYKYRKCFARRSLFFAAVEPQFGEGIVRLANRVAVWRHSEVYDWFLDSSRAWIFSPERSLNQPKDTRVRIRSINQTNRSISVRFLLLFRSRVFISRWLEIRSNKRHYKHAKTEEQEHPTRI